MAELEGLPCRARAGSTLISGVEIGADPWAADGQGVVLNFEPFMVSASPLDGKSARDHRWVLDATSWAARIGAPWRDLSAKLGIWNSAFRHWIISGLGTSCSGPWPMAAGLTSRRGSEAPLPGRITAPPTEGGPRRNDLGRSRGGFTNKLHIHGNAHGRPAHRAARDRRAGSRLLELRRADGSA